jgi:hypothetical protein
VSPIDWALLGVLAFAAVLVMLSAAIERMEP